jgi:UDPglucose 6-dehydrogenase
VQALVETGKEQGFTFQIIEAVDRVNDAQKLRPYTILKKTWKSLKGKQIAIWGLSFKPRTDDVREAPAIGIIEHLLKAGAHVAAYDPVAMESFHEAQPQLKIAYHKNAEEVLEGADALVILTEWDEFRSADLARVHDLMKGNVLIDGRNIFERDEAEEADFVYFGIGV